MRFALVGLGYWGTKLLRNLVNIVGATNVVAVDIDAGKVSKAIHDYPGVQSAPDLMAALDMADVGAVIVATPAQSHCALGSRALVAGRHLLVEKPMACSVTEATKLTQLADEHQLVLMVGHTFMFSPRLRWMADYVARGQLGRVHYLTSSRLNLGVHNPVTNVIWDLCPHDFSIALRLIGEMPKTVQAVARSLVQPNVPDVAFVNMTFPSGAIASFDVSWLAPRKVRNTMVVGDQNMVVWDDTDPEDPVKVFDNSVAGFDPPGMVPTYRHGATSSPDIPAAEPLENELRAFVDAALGRDRSSADLSDGKLGLEVTQLLEATDLSWRRGGTPITIEEALTPQSSQLATVSITAPVAISLIAPTPAASTPLPAASTPLPAASTPIPAASSPAPAAGVQCQTVA